MANSKEIRIKEVTEVLNNINNALANWGAVYQLNVQNWKSGSEDDYYKAFIADQERLTNELFALKFEA